MAFFLAALGLLLAIEGLTFAAFPGAAKRAAALIAEAPEGALRAVFYPFLGVKPGYRPVLAGAAPAAPVLCSRSGPLTRKRRRP